jgi:hypothetical protein
LLNSAIILKVAVSNLDEFIGFFFFNLLNSSNRTMALGLTNPLTEMSTRNHKYGKPSLQVSGVSDETVKYGYGFCATRTIE